jgi:hypothetical protein
LLVARIKQFVHFLSLPRESLPYKPPAMQTAMKSGLTALKKKEETAAVTVFRLALIPDSRGIYQ